MAETPTGEELNPTPLRKSTINKADANLLQNVNIGGAPLLKRAALRRQAKKLQPAASMMTRMTTKAMIPPDAPPPPRTR